MNAAPGRSEPATTVIKSDDGDKTDIRVIAEMSTVDPDDHRIWYRVDGVHTKTHMSMIQCETFLVRQGVSKTVARRLMADASNDLIAQYESARVAL